MSYNFSGIHYVLSFFLVMYLLFCIVSCKQLFHVFSFYCCLIHKFVLFRFDSLPLQELPTFPPLSVSNDWILSSSLKSFTNGALKFSGSI